MTVSHLKQAAFWVPWAWITYSALTPTPGFATFGIWDKLLHFLAFAYLMAALWFAYGERVGLLAAAIALIGYGAAIEILQIFIPNRFFGIFDLVADALGIAVAAVLVVQVAGAWASTAGPLRPAR